MRGRRITTKLMVNEIVVADGGEKLIEEHVYNDTGREISKYLKDVSIMEVELKSDEGAYEYTVETVLLHPHEYERLKIIEKEFIRQLKEEQDL